MKFEILPSEILYTCFNYLNVFDIFHSFDQLNSRFNKLIRNIRLHINFKNINKTIFDQFCTKILLNTEIKTQIYSLNFPDKNVYFQTKIFLSLFSLNEFPNLQILEIISPLKHPGLYSIWDKPYFNIKNKQNHISFSKLRTLSVSIIPQSIIDTHEILSLVNLTITDCCLTELCKLLKHTPMLKYLYVQRINYVHNRNIKRYSNDQYVFHLKQLIIDEFQEKFQNFKIFIKQAPNLKSLSISTYDNKSIIDAYQWECLITSSLPYLDVFNFKFCIFCHETIANSYIEKFKQFQTKFWQEKHHWFTEYVVETYLLFIYTIPYTLNTYSLSTYQTRYCNQSINNANTFSNVKDLHIFERIPIKKYSYYFSNITSLIITCYYLPTKDVESLKMYCNLFNLKHLDISYFYDIKSSLDLFEIIKQTSQLSSLTINFNFLKKFLKNNKLCTYLNKMIRKLYIKKFSIKSSNDLERKKFCEIFTNIKYLKCDINDDNDLSFLLNHFSQLSSLKVISTNNNGLNNAFLKFQNEVRKLNIIYDMKGEWMQDADGCDVFEIRLVIWIGKRLN